MKVCCVFLLVSLISIVFLALSLNAIIAIIFVFGITVFSHELGHFLVARKSGMRVHEFSIGFGPKIFSISRNEVKYSLRILPIFSYVRIAGIEPGDDVPDGFDKKGLGARFATIFSGSFVNIVLGFLFFGLLGAWFGLPHPHYAAVIEKVEKGKPAALAGLKPGDKIVGINNIKEPYLDDVIKVVKKSYKKDIKLTVLRDSRRLIFHVSPFYDKLEKRARIGIGFALILKDLEFEKAGFFKSMGMVAKNLYQMIAGVITRKVPAKEVAEVRGPVGVVDLILKYLKWGVAGILLITGGINLGVGLLNLLPFPALDGSRLVFLVVEGIRGKPVDLRKEAMVHYIGILLLLSFVVWVTYQDLLRLLVERVARSR